MMPISTVHPIHPADAVAEFRRRAAPALHLLELGAEALASSGPDRDQLDSIVGTSTKLSANELLIRAGESVAQAAEDVLAGVGAWDPTPRNPSRICNG